MIVHIVPTVPPAINGLADYCFKLSRNWPDAGSSWGCLALEVPPDAQEKWPDSTLLKFEPSQKDLVEVLEGINVDTLIVHYVGYAYQAKGIPTWLPAALKIWKRSHPQARLVVMFHELWAVGPPWRSCFWVLPTAKSIVSTLARISDAWVTSCERYFDNVISVGGAASRGAVIPIATGIEPTTFIDFERPWPLFAEGKLKIAVFGLASTRNSALSLHSGLLKALCQAGLVEQISVLGQSPRTVQDKQNLETIMAQIGHDELWQQIYDLSSEKISDLLREHDIGFVKETASLLTKSSVFAVLCSHGVLPVCTASSALDEKLDSPFLIDLDVTTCLSALQNKQIINDKKRNVGSIATTSLNWSSVATLWMRHIERPQ